MARTYVWDKDIPLGSEDPGQIDNWFRRTRTDVQELINQLLGVAESTALADPVISAADSLAGLLTTANANSGSTNLVLTLPWYGVRDNETGAVLGDGLYWVNGASATGTLYIPVPLPVGVTVTKVGIRWAYNSTNHSATGTFQVHTGTAVVASGVASASAASASAQWVNSGTLAITLAADEFCMFKIILDNNNLDTGTALGVYAVRVEYTSPTAKVRI